MEATIEQIKEARKEMLLRWHPDHWHNGSPEEKAEAEKNTRRTNTAYDRLSDPAKRALYDAALKAQQNMAGAAGKGVGPQWAGLVDVLLYAVSAPVPVKMHNDAGEEVDGGISIVQLIYNLNANIERLNATLIGYFEESDEDDDKEDIDEDGEVWRAGLVDTLNDLADEVSANTDISEKALKTVSGNDSSERRNRKRRKK